MSRGYAAIGLVNPKSHVNVGSVLRAAQVFGAAMVVATGQRYQRSCTDTMLGYRHLPFIDHAEDVFDYIPYDCEPVAVDILPEACPLPQFVHPRSAFYVFGAEDNTLSPRIVKRCSRKVQIPSLRCLNLAMAVNVVLYDRMAKEFKK